MCGVPGLSARQPVDRQASRPGEETVILQIYVRISRGRSSNSVQQPRVWGVLVSIKYKIYIEILILSLFQSFLKIFVSMSPLQKGFTYKPYNVTGSVTTPDLTYCY